MKKVAILSAFLSPLRSGAEACAEEVPLQLYHEFDFQIITARMRRDVPKQDLLQGKIPVVRVGFGCTFDKWLFPFLAPLAVRKFKPDVCHAVLETFAGLALVFCKAPKKILTCQTTNRSFLKSFVVSKAGHVTAISTALLKTVSQFRTDEITLIPNGIAVDELTQAAAKSKRDLKTLLFVGRVEKQKGIDTLLSALTLLPADVRLKIVGDGSKRQSLQALAKELGLQERVTFLGKIAPAEIAPTYASAEIFCGLSRAEALGNVFLEAQAAGCAVVGTTVDGIPDSVTNEHTGLLVEPDNPEAAADAIRRLLEDEQLRSALQKNGAENAATYDWSSIAARYKCLY